MSAIAYKTHTVDLTTLPPVSVVALAQRGLVRLLGSEVAAKVANEFKSVPDVTDEARDAFAESCRQEILSQLAAGSLGTHRAGPRKDPVESEMSAIAVREVKETLKAHKLSFTRPGKDEDKFEPYVLFGNGQKRTLSEMVSKRLADHAERIRKAAEKAIADAKRLAEKVAAGLPDTGEAVTADDLGL